MPTDTNKQQQIYYHQLLSKLRKSNRHEVFKETREEADERITVDTVIDRLCISGSVDKVVDETAWEP